MEGSVFTGAIEEDCTAVTINYDALLIIIIIIDNTSFAGRRDAISRAIRRCFCKQH